VGGEKVPAFDELEMRYRTYHYRDFYYLAETYSRSEEDANGHEIRGV